jgi:hypothetical protein
LAILGTRGISEMERPLHLPQSWIAGIEEMGRGQMDLCGQLNRTFVVGLAGAAITSLGLFTLFRADGEIRDEGRTKLTATSDCLSHRQQIATTFRSDIEMTAFNLPQIQFDNRE